MKISLITSILISLVLTACGGKLMSTATTPTTTSSRVLGPGEAEPGVRLIFSKNNFSPIFY